MLSLGTNKPLDMGLGLMINLESEERGGYGEWEVFVVFVVLLLAWQSAEEKRGIFAKENRCVSIFEMIGG